MGIFLLCWLVIASPFVTLAATSSYKSQTLVLRYHNESFIEEKLAILGSDNLLHLSQHEKGSGIQLHVSNDGMLSTTDGKVLAVDENHSLYYTQYNLSISASWSLESASNGDNFVRFMNSDKFVVCPGKSGFVIKWNFECSGALPVQLMLSLNQKHSIDSAQVSQGSQPRKELYEGLDYESSFPELREPISSEQDNSTISPISRSKRTATMDPPDHIFRIYTLINKVIYYIHITGEGSLMLSNEDGHFFNGLLDFNGLLFLFDRQDVVGICGKELCVHPETDLRWSVQMVNDKFDSIKPLDDRKLFACPFGNHYTISMSSCQDGFDISLKVNFGYCESNCNSPKLTPEEPSVTTKTTTTSKSTTEQPKPTGLAENTNGITTSNEPTPTITESTEVHDTIDSTTNNEYHEIFVNTENKRYPLQIVGNKIVCRNEGARKLVVKESEGKFVTEDGKELKISQEGDLVVDNLESGLPNIRFSYKMADSDDFITWDSNTPIVICQYSTGYIVKVEGGQCDDAKPAKIVEEKTGQAGKKQREQVSIEYTYLGEREVESDKLFNIVCQGAPNKGTTILSIRGQKIVAEAPQNPKPETEGLKVKLTAEGYLETRSGGFLSKPVNDNLVTLSADKNLAVKWSISQKYEGGKKISTLVCDKEYQLTVCETPEGMVLMWNAECSGGGFKPEFHAAETKTVTKTVYETKTLAPEIQTLVKTISGERHTITTTVTYYPKASHDVAFTTRSTTSSTNMASPTPTKTDKQGNKKPPKTTGSQTQYKSNENKKENGSKKETGEIDHVPRTHEKTLKEEEHTGEFKSNEGKKENGNKKETGEIDHVPRIHEKTPKEEEHTGNRWDTNSRDKEHDQGMEVRKPKKPIASPLEIPSIPSPEAPSTTVPRRDQSEGNCLSSITVKIEINNLVISDNKIVAVYSEEDKGISFCITESGHLKTSTGKYVVIAPENKYLEVTSDKSKGTIGWSFGDNANADEGVFKNIVYKGERAAVGCPSDKGFIVGWNCQCDNQVKISLSARVRATDTSKQEKMDGDTSHSRTMRINGPIITTLPPNLIIPVKESEPIHKFESTYVATISSQKDKTISYFSFDIPFESMIPNAKTAALQFWLPQKLRFPSTVSGEGIIEVYLVPDLQLSPSKTLPKLDKSIGNFDAKNPSIQEIPLPEIKYGQVYRIALMAKSENTFVSFFQTLQPFTGLRCVIKA